MGNLLLESAENEIKKLNGDLIVVHAQVRIHPFYEKQGYIQFGQIDDDEGVPHMWMKKRYSIKLLYPKYPSSFLRVPLSFQPIKNKSQHEYPNLL